MTKDTVPQNYTYMLSLFDAVPVILFGFASYLLWRMSGSVLLLLGGAICFVTGMLKVLWKIIVVMKHKNIWPLFVQMRIGMPLGLILMLAGFIASCLSKNMVPFWHALSHPAPILTLILFVAGIVAMMICGTRLDASEAKTNWIEQSCNTLAQGMFFLTMLLIWKTM